MGIRCKVDDLAGHRLGEIIAFREGLHRVFGRYHLGGLYPIFAQVTMAAEQAPPFLYAILHVQMATKLLIAASQHNIL